MIERLRRQFHVGGPYLVTGFLKHIDRKRVKTIFELGSRDCVDAINLSRFYKAQVFSFECNPDSLKLCRENLKINIADQIVLVEKAVWNMNDKIKFYPVNAAKSLDPNIGASSCLPLNFAERSRPEWRMESCIQDEIVVDAIRIDNFCQSKGIKEVDMFCMDLEGAELEALEGSGELLSTVKYIVTEVSYEPIRKGQRGVYKKLIEYLNLRGFDLIAERRESGNIAGDALFINRTI